MRATAPRSRDGLDALARRQLKKLARAWLSPLICLVVAVPIPLVVAATQDSLDTFSRVFLGIWMFGAFLIALSLYVHDRRKAGFLDRLLVEGEALTGTIVELIRISKRERQGPARFHLVRAETTTPDGTVTYAVKVHSTVAAHLDPGMTCQVVVHPEIPSSLWVFAEGFPPAQGTAALP